MCRPWNTARVSTYRAHKSSSRKSTLKKLHSQPHNSFLSGFKAQDDTFEGRKNPYDLIEPNASESIVDLRALHRSINIRMLRKSTLYVLDSVLKVRLKRTESITLQDLLRSVGPEPG
mmetsp:Transcript_14152/g.56920  ORF Transcript_14152/g.56920 Transcript_14152/m.56920 type:complete len:117 (+) Transcript_14152:1862-2212(+)